MCQISQKSDQAYLLVLYIALNMFLHLIDDILFIEVMGIFMKLRESLSIHKTDLRESQQISYGNLEETIILSYHT
jgi:hypothetical protein